MLTRTTGSHLKLMAELQPMKGNQGKWQRRNGDGYDRSRRMQRLQTQLSFFRKPFEGGLGAAKAAEAKEKISFLLDEIPKLQKVHQREELMREVQDMDDHLTHMKSLLGEQQQVS